MATLIILEAQPAYNRTIQAYMKRRDALINKRLDAIDNLFRSSSDKVNYFIRNVKENQWKNTNSSELISSINHEINLLDTKIKALMISDLKSVVDFTKERVDKSIEVLGVDVPYMPLQTGSIVELETMLVNTLVKGQTAATKAGIDYAVRSGVAGGKSTFEVAKEISQKFDVALYKTNRQARTEMLRIDSMTDFKRTTQLAQTIGGLRKNWLWSHKPDGRPTHADAEIRYEANPIPIDEYFSVGKAKLMYPHDPAGPPGETINCGCKMGKVIVKG